MIIKRAFLGLGSNLGKRSAYIDQALSRLDEHPKISLIRVAAYYETDPVGFTDQGKFINTAAEVRTSLSPLMLLAYCQQIEQLLKRRRAVRWGPRTIDIDLLVYSDVRSSQRQLSLPHPRMKERPFVIYPLMEIEPTLLIDGEPLSLIQQRLSSEGIVRLVPDPSSYACFSQLEPVDQRG